MDNNYLDGKSLLNLQNLSKILGKPLTFVDLEATGLVHEHHFSIIEIGLITILPDAIVEKSALVDPKMSIPYYITELTGIDDSMVKGKKTFEHFNSHFEKVAKNHIFCGFNSKAFDATGIVKMARKYGKYYSFDNQLDIRYLFLRNRNLLLNSNSRKGSLTEASQFYKTDTLSGNAHRAAYDIALTVLLAEKILEHHGLSTLLPDIEKFNCIQTKNNFKQYIKNLKIGRAHV